MKARDIIKLLVSLVIITLILYYLHYEGYFEIFRQVTLTQLALLIGLTLLSYIVSGFQLYILVKLKMGLNLKVADIILLPLSMSLFSYVIPTNGGLLYSVFFLKKKYNIETAQGFSVGVFTIYISFIITGLLGLIASLFFGKTIIYLLLLSLLFILSPLLVFYVNKLAQMIRTRPGTFPDKVKHYLNAIVFHSHEMINNKKITAVNIAITVISLGVYFVSYYWLNLVLKMNLPVTSIIALIIMLRISTLVRLLPGNLGLEELFTAGIFAVLGKDPSIGLVFAVFMRMCTLIVSIPLGILHTTFNSKHFSFSDIKRIIRKKNA